MKIVVIGATGTIGSALVQLIKQHQPEFEVVTIGRGNRPNHPLDYIADFEDMATLRAVFEQIGYVDAIVNFAGTASIGSIFGSKAMDKDAFNVGLQSKLLGQIELAQIGLEHLNPHGSIVLTSGETSSVPLKGMTAASMVNAAVDAFVRGAAIELTDGKRINSISPGMIKQTLEQIPGISTEGGIDVEDVAHAYLNAVQDETLNGQSIVVTTKDNVTALKTFEAVLANMAS